MNQFIFGDNIINNNNVRKDYLKLLNAFRSEYFNGASPFKITDAQLMTNKQEGIIPCIFYHYNRAIAIVELTTGHNYGQPALAISTVYVIPKYRGRNISQEIYSAIEQLAENMDMQFCIHVEESSVVNNLDKFLKLGFTCYDVINEFCNNRDYKETTYVLFKKQYVKRYRVLDKFAIGEAA